MNKVFLKTCKELDAWLTTVDATKLSFDTETDGLRYGSNIVGVSICNGVDACYINLYNNTDSWQILVILSDILSNCQLLIGHNAKYDIKAFRGNGHIIKDVKLYDTMIAAHLLNENASCGLKDLMRRKLKYTKIIEWKDAAPKGFDSKEFEEYGITDAIATWQMYELTKPLIEKGGFHKLFYDIEMPFQWVLVDLESNGVEIDKDYLKELDTTLNSQRGILEVSCVKSLGMEMRVEKGLFGQSEISSPVNFNSPKQLLHIIQNKLGLELPYKTDKDNPSTGKESLNLLKGKHPFIDNLLEWRKVEKLYNTFVHPMFDHIYSDGRVRPNFNDCVAVTGRLSSDNPNGQNLPKGKKTDTYKIRKMFKAKSGYKLIHADWSGQELRVCAVVSNDSGMIDAFLKDKDLHLTTANEWLELDVPEDALYKSHPDYKKYAKQFDDERDIGKNGVNFPIIYGTTAYGIALNNNISEEKAQAGIDAFFTLYPNVKKAIALCKKSLYMNKSVITMLGRKRRFWIINNKAIRQAFNFLIQGYCADLLRIAMTLLRLEYKNHPEWDAKLVLTVHDSVDTEVKEEFAEIVAQRMKEIMEGCSGLVIPLPVDIKILDVLE